MSQEAIQKVKQSAQADHGWKNDQMRVDEVEALRRDDCSFFTAASTATMSSTQKNYAVVKGAVVTGKNAAATILAQCGKDAPALWKAEVVTRFAPGLGGLVLTNDSNKAAIRRVKAAGKFFGDPKAEGDSVDFYLLEPEAFVVSHIRATRTGDTLNVEHVDL